MAKLKKPSRRPGEKPKRKSKLRPLEWWKDPRVPTGHKNLTVFLHSLDKTTTVEEAIREYQDEWCTHPKIEQTLISTVAFGVEERYEYTVGCGECGRLKTYKGRPPSKLTKRGWK